MSDLALHLGQEIGRGSFPGAGALIGSGEAVLEAAVAGHAALEPVEEEVGEETLFDLASLTKPLAAAELSRLAVSSGLSLEWPPGRFLPEWKRTRYDGITLAMLLTHTSGLPAWFPLYARGEGAQAYRRTLGEIEPAGSPGGAVIYSDVGFLVLGEVLEAFFSAPLERSFRDLVAQPAGSGAHFLPDRGRAAAATEKGDRFERRMTLALGLSYGGFREGVVRGEVHDGNALRRAGVAAHAGLFGTARDVWRLARTWLLGGGSGFLEDRTPDFPEARTLGWQGSRGAASAVPAFSGRAFGHTGFTGTSLWVDPERDRIFVLLTNRIHPEVADVDFQEVRRRFHERAIEISQ